MCVAITFYQVMLFVQLVWFGTVSICLCHSRSQMRRLFGHKIYSSSRMISLLLPLQDTISCLAPRIIKWSIVKQICLTLALFVLSTFLARPKVKLPNLCMLLEVPSEAYCISSIVRQYCLINEVGFWSLKKSKILIYNTIGLQMQIVR